MLIPILRYIRHHDKRYKEKPQIKKAAASITPQRPSLKSSSTKILPYASSSQHLARLGYA
jgi:hypothetical protein